MTRSFTSLDDEGFNRLFRDFRETAFRLETRQRYEVPYEQNEFTRFMTGESRGEFPGIAAWCDTVRAAVAAGKRMHRVHVITEPVSDFIRFECGWAYEHAVAAGEDVRLMMVGGDEWAAELPQYDYWLFDSTELVALHYNEDGQFVSGELISEREQVARARLWRDFTATFSIPYRQYADQLQLGVP